MMSAQNIREHIAIARESGCTRYVYTTPEGEQICVELGHAPTQLATAKDEDTTNKRETYRRETAARSGGYVPRTGS